MAGWEALSAGVAATNNLIATHLSNQNAKEINDQQIRWERERAQHAHQWEVKDLEAAGLNPVLSAGGSGATTGSISPVQTDFSGIGRAGEIMSAALDRFYDNEIKKEQALNINADTEKKKQETKESESKIKLNEQNIKNLRKQIDKIDSDINRNNILNSKDKAEIAKIGHEITKIDSEVDLNEIEMRLKYAKIDLMKELQLLTTIKEKQGLETYKSQVMQNKILKVQTKMRYVDKYFEEVQKVADIGGTIISSVIPFTNGPSNKIGFKVN